MQPLKRTMRAGAIAGASVLAMALAYPALSADLSASPGSTVSTPTRPDVGEGYRPDPTLKTVAEMEREQAQNSVRTNTPAQNGDMNKIGETRSGRPVENGTGVSGRQPVQPMSGQTGDMNRPAVTNGGSASSGMRDGAFPTDSANLSVQQVRMQDLSPAQQAAVRGRMDGRQTPNELIETTILNRVALMGSEFRLDSARRVGNDYVLKVSNPNGQKATLLYEPKSDSLREVQL